MSGACYTQHAYDMRMHCHSLVTCDKHVHIVYMKQLLHYLEERKMDTLDELGNWIIRFKPWKQYQHIGELLPYYLDINYSQKMKFQKKHAGLLMYVAIGFSLNLFFLPLSLSLSPFYCPASLTLSSVIELDAELTRGFLI